MSSFCSQAEKGKKERRESGKKAEEGCARVHERERLPVTATSLEQSNKRKGVSRYLVGNAACSP